MRANSDARRTAHVDFPTPPLGLANTITGIFTTSPEWKTYIRLWIYFQHQIYFWFVL
jgi:hypothetical protein